MKPSVTAAPAPLPDGATLIKGSLPTPVPLVAQPNLAAAHTTGKSSPLLVVKRGDSVYKVLLGVYGRVDEDMIKSFKILNPQVKNINRISVGETIILPGVEPVKP
jgi:hypothetical protein